MSKKNNSFVVELPDNWIDQSIYQFVGPEDNGQMHVLTLLFDQNSEGKSLQEFARERIDIILDSLPNPEVLKEEERTLASGVPVIELVIKMVPDDKTRIYRKFYYMLIDGKGYTFVAEFSKKTLRTIAVDVERIINSFRPAL